MKFTAPIRTIAAAALLFAAISACAQKKNTALRLPLEGQNPRGLLVTLEIEGRKALFVVDTGTTATMIDAEAFHLRTNSDSTVPVQQANQRSERRVYRLEIGVAGQKLRGYVMEVDLSGARKECGCELMGLLGMDVLSQYAAVEIDFRERVIWLKP